MNTPLIVLTIAIVLLQVYIYRKLSREEKHEQI